MLMPTRGSGGPRRPAASRLQCSSSGSTLNSVAGMSPSWTLSKLQPRTAHAVTRWEGVALCLAQGTEGTHALTHTRSTTPHRLLDRLLHCACATTQPVPVTRTDVAPPHLRRRSAARGAAHSRHRSPPLNDHTHIDSETATHNSTASGLPSSCGMTNATGCSLK